MLYYITATLLFSCLSFLSVLDYSYIILYYTTLHYTIVYLRLHRGASAGQATQGLYLDHSYNMLYYVTATLYYIILYYVILYYVLCIMYYVLCIMYYYYHIYIYMNSTIFLSHMISNYD